LENFDRNEKPDDEKTSASDGTVEMDLNGDAKVSKNGRDVSGRGHQQQPPCLEGRSSSSECRPSGEYHCVYTDLPKFLVTYSPKVWQRCPFAFMKI
jgi:hypothetical protein